MTHTAAHPDIRAAWEGFSRLWLRTIGLYWLKDIIPLSLQCVLFCEIISLVTETRTLSCV